MVSVIRKSAIEHLDAAVKAYLDWRAIWFSKGKSKVAVVPPPPIKFLDMGTKMGLYEVEGLIPNLKDASSVLHCRSTHGVPKAGTFYETIREKLGRTWVGDQACCETKNAWAQRSPSCDFHVADPLGYIWPLRLCCHCLNIQCWVRLL